VSALLGTSAFTMAALAWSRGAPLSSTLLATGAIGAAALAASSRQLLPQVFSRAVTWLTFGPSAIALLTLLATGRSVAEPLPFAVAGGLALIAGAPLLHTREAHDPFAPRRFRRAWIAAATASLATAIVAGAVAVWSAWWGELGFAAFAAAMALGLAAGARSVLEMRGLGVVLGAATSLAAVTAAALTGFLPLLLAAIPGAMLAAPVLLSRLVPDDGDEGDEGHAKAAEVEARERTRRRAVESDGPLRIGASELGDEARDDAEELADAADARGLRDRVS
jgi:hypothetical protein